MPVRMNMGFIAFPIEVVRVLMMFVLLVRMIVFQHFVSMRMFVLFADMEPDSHAHERRRDPEWQRWKFRPEHQR